MNIIYLCIGLSVAIPFLLHINLIPFIIGFSHKFELFDVTDHRKTHVGNISRLGGISLFLSFILPSILIFSIYFKNFNTEFQVKTIFFILLTGLSFLLGLIDDLVTIRARQKLAGQIIIAITACILGFSLSVIQIPFTRIIFHLGLFSIPLSLFWIIGATNSLNLMDGMDGMAGGISCLAAFFLGLTALWHGNFTTALLCFLMVGSTMGFLFFNFPPARIFMGDGGSLQLGFFLAVIPFLGITSRPEMDFYIILLLMSLPVLDTFCAIIRRVSRGQHFFTPDREHLHHKLQDLGLSRRRILGYIYSYMIILGMGGFFFSIMPQTLAFAGFISLILLTTGGFCFIEYKNGIQKKILDKGYRGLRIYSLRENIKKDIAENHA